MHRRVLLVMLTVLVGCRPAAPSARYVFDWATLSYEVARATGRPVVEATRASAYVAIAMHEAYAAEPGSPLQTMAGQLNGLWFVPTPSGVVDGASAAAEAARTVLDSLFPGSGAGDSLAAAQIALRKRELVSDEVQQRSLEYGRTIAATLLTWSRTDGLSSVMRRAKAAKPARQAATDAEWGTLRTFVVRNADECSVPAAPAYSTRPTSDFWKMAKASYDSARTASPDAIAIARFWAEDTGAGRSTASRWTSILRTVALDRAVSAHVAVESFLLVSLSMADAEISSRRQMYKEMVVAPAVYVRRAVNAEWTPLVSADGPQYPSLPAAVAGAASEVLARAFSDTAAFADSVGSVVRRLSGFGQARDEIAMAGVHLGVHYTSSAEQGRWQGQCVGGKTLGRLRTRR